jgi:hypothetical protein
MNSPSSRLPIPFVSSMLTPSRPNSLIESYVTASCTDGNTYVWDTAQGDDPIHVLGHGGKFDSSLSC